MPDPYSRPGEIRDSAISFCVAMTDDEIRELLVPHEPDRIDRGKECGKVYFHGAEYVEEANVRGKFTDWWNAWSERQPKKPPFDLETFLISKGIPLEEKDVLEFLMDDGTRKKYRMLPNGRTRPS